MSVPNSVKAEAVKALVRDDGRLYPEDLVEAAKAADHPLHDCFEWDEVKAAEAYRRHKAESLVGSIHAEGGQA